MCGIVGIAGSAPVANDLLAGLKRLEYRGYDSSGLAVIDAVGKLDFRRAAGKLVNLEAVVAQTPIEGGVGIAHTRWATHGKPTEANAHPHTAGPVSIVHNGIIENFQVLKSDLEGRGHEFSSETDSEVIAHLIWSGLKSGQSMTDAFRNAIQRLTGAYAVAAISEEEPDKIWAARAGSPLVIGLGETQCFVGSDAIALAGWTRRIIHLEEGDSAIVSGAGTRVFDASHREVARQVQISNVVPGMADKGEHRHFMEKEIHEQPEAVARTLAGFVDANSRSFQLDQSHDWTQTDRLIASACGTAYYALSVAKYWFESYAKLPVEVDIASELRYRQPVLTPGNAALFVSQSGETADTLAALRHCKDAGLPTLGLVNVEGSTMSREVEQVLYTQAGPELGVASTKAFTAQLAALACMAAGIARQRGHLPEDQERQLVDALLETPRLINDALAAEPEIEAIAQKLVHSRDVLYLGRGVFFPLALEGALKLKEISYIHAEGYAAGELKHGPIALIEEGSNVVVIAPKNELFEKTLSNMQEVAARGAKVVLLTDQAGADAVSGMDVKSVVFPTCHALVQPIIASVHLQLLAYHVAVLKGTDVDQPRNLAKSVTVE